MSRSICLRCRASLLQALCSQKRHPYPTRRAYSSQNEQRELLDIAALLSKPTWSVRSSLLPSASEKPTEEITPQTLHHLLRLSALPQPKSPEEEAEMLKTLHSQLYFVKDIQSVDTEGVEPLQSIRDETKDGIREATIGLDDLRETLNAEEFVGRNRRPRRRRGAAVTQKEVEGWDVFGTATETVEFGGGRFFVVRSGKDDSLKDLSKDEPVKFDDTQKE